MRTNSGSRAGGSQRSMGSDDHWMWSWNLDILWTVRILNIATLWYGTDWCTFMFKIDIWSATRKLSCRFIKADENFRFGPSGPFKCTEKLRFKLDLDQETIFIDIAIVDADIPMLLGNNLLKPLEAQINLFKGGNGNIKLGDVKLDMRKHVVDITQWKSRILVSCARSLLQHSSCHLVISVVKLLKMWRFLVTTNKMYTPTIKLNPFWKILLKMQTIS